MKETVQITGEYIRLCDLLKFANLCQSGGEAKAVILDGLVNVNGEVCIQKGKKIRPGDLVFFEGNEISVTI